MERWLPVVGFEGFYEVSDLGRVRSVARAVPYRDGRKPRYSQSVALSPWRNKLGYRLVSLKIAGRKANICVYTAVSAAFMGPTPAGLEICHGPLGNESDAASNLRFDTHTANMKDRELDGNTARGISNGRAKLSDDDVLEIKSRWPGESQRALASEFGVSHTVIWQITSGKCWGHLNAASS